MIRSELVELWKCRVQYLRQYYCFHDHRPKQRGYPILSPHVWFIPCILTLWWTIMAVIFLFALKLEHLLNTGDVMNVPNFIFLGLNCILMVSWWKLAIDQSDGITKPSPSNGKYCNTSKDVLSSLRQNWKYIQRRGLSCIVHHFDYLMIALLLLMLAGDIETNPGPDPLTMDDYFAVIRELNILKDGDIVRVGEALGLNYDRMKDLPDMVASWLREDDNVRRSSGPPTWASLANALEAYGHTRIASRIRTKYLADYKEALQRGKVKVAYARVVLLGAGGSGKSSFQRGMKNELFKELDSTQLADINAMKLRAISTTTAKGEGGYWVSVDENDEKNELVGLVRLVFNVRSGKVESTRVVEESERSDVDTVNPVSAEPAHSESPTYSAVRRSVKKIIDEIIELAKKDPTAQAPESEVYLNVWDCGGQQVFLNILPAFLTPKSIFFLIFDARNDLHKPCTSLSHLHCQVKSEEELNISTMELLSQWMSHIDATTLRGNRSEIPEYPRIVLVGTHGDDPNVKKNKASILDNLCVGYSNSTYADLVKDAVIIDNTTSGTKSADPGYKKVLDIVYRFTSNDKVMKDTPVTWVLFRRMLHLEAKKKPYFKLTEVEEIADACDIKQDKVHSVLRFYHDFAVFFHYDDITSLKDWVIADPKKFIKDLAKLLALKGFEEEKDNSLKPLWDHLRNKGILVEKLYVAIWKSHQLQPEGMIALLEKFLIMSPIKTEYKVEAGEGKEYFVPCVLPPSPTTQDSARTLRSCKKQAAPLHLIFTSLGYVAPGFFTRLATALSKKEGYEIVFNGIYRNKVSFLCELSGSEIDTLTISEGKYSVQIDLIRKTPRTSSLQIFSNVCLEVKKSIEECCTDIRKWFPGIKTSFAFCCDQCSASSHEHFVCLKPETTRESILHCQEEKERVYKFKEDEKNWLQFKEFEHSADPISESEVQTIAEEVQKNPEKIKDLKDALEMSESEVEEPKDIINCWINQMKQMKPESVQPRPHLVHYLKCIGMGMYAEKLKTPKLKLKLPKNRKRNTAFIVFIVILVVLLLIGLLICCVQINLEYFQSDSTEGVDNDYCKPTPTPTASDNQFKGSDPSQVLTMDDHHAVTQELNDLSNEDLIRVGGALGLHHPNLKRSKNILPDMVTFWLRQDDRVTETSGSPTWASLATALEDVGHTGVASRIRKKYLAETA